MRGGAAVAAAAVLLAACRGGSATPPGPVATGGDADRGMAVIESKRCGACHTIPGIRSARGKVAPPLDFFSERSFIAGEVPNTTENLVRWVRDPQSIEPRTAMPALGLDEQEARDVAAYLYTLR